MSPLVAHHVTRRVCRDSIFTHGLLPNRPQRNRPYGVYVFGIDDSLDHPGWNTTAVWDVHPTQDLWEVSYIGPMMDDQYVLNALIFLGTCDHVSLVTGNSE